MRRGQRKQIFAIVFSVICVAIYAYPLYDDWSENVIHFIADPLIVIGAHERIMVHLIVSLIGLMIIFVRIIYLVGKLIE